MPAVAHDLWSLTWGRPHIDPCDLATAVEHQAARADELDFRTRLLIRESIRAIENCWGEQRARAWIEASPQRGVIESILHADFGPDGFPTLSQRVKTTVKPDDVLEYLRTLGSRTTRPARLAIGDSIALILAGQLSRPTDDIDVVDEVPADLRAQHELLAELSKRFGLHLTHFQSHYLPTGWENRTRAFGAFGTLQVSLVDSYDIFLSKLFSPRDKDVDDLRVLKAQLDKQHLTDRLLDTTTAFCAEPALKKCAEQNWYILFGEPLPAKGN